MSAQSAAFTETPSRPLASAACYAIFYPALVKVARAHGYALAIHGSMTRDCDLIAVPWVDKVSSPLELIKALKEACGGVYSSDEWDYLIKNGNPTNKPHGRLAYSLHLTNDGMRGPYFDVSVMPIIPHELEAPPTPCAPVCS